MMNDIEKLLEYVQKTNPDMTKEKLIKELGKCHYSSVSLFVVFENNKEKQEVLI